MHSHKTINQNGMMDKVKLTGLIVKCINDALSEEGFTRNQKITSDTQLYGNKGLLDSLGLVRLIAELEEEIYSQTQKEITLADEKAMSAVSSPFRSVEALSDYIEILLKELD